MFRFFKKKTEEISRTTPGFEETERRTPKAGVILLLVMFVAALFFGWRALDDLGRIPNKPQQLSDCSYRYRKSVFLSESPVRPPKGAYLYYEYGDSSQCGFSDLEKANPAIGELSLKRVPLEKELQKIYDDLNAATRSLEEARYQLERLTGEYSVGLEEKREALPEPVFPISGAKQSIAELREKEAQLSKQKTDLEAREKTLREQIKSIDNQLVEAYKPVLKEQNKRLRWYEFKVFLLQFIFTLPFFWLVFRWYAKLHKKDSPYTVISIAVLAVAGILLLRIVLFWFWGLFLERVLETILEWFRKYNIVRTILSYLGMLVSIGIFGGAVYWLQKRVFDPRRVTLRRFRAKQCPQCQASLDLAEMYCPNCGHHVREKCANCGEPRFVGLPHCPHCGK